VESVDAPTPKALSQIWKLFEFRSQPLSDMLSVKTDMRYLKTPTAQKMKIQRNFTQALPFKLAQGNGNWAFKFSKNYAILIYYCLIWFRNYQAANINIIFLVFACYIIQRHLDSSFLRHLKAMVAVVARNHSLKAKSDEFELFLGKSGKNVFFGPRTILKEVKEWCLKVNPCSLSHF